MILNENTYFPIVVRNDAVAGLHSTQTFARILTNAPDACLIGFSPAVETNTACVLQMGLLFLKPHCLGSESDYPILVGRTDERMFSFLRVLESDPLVYMFEDVGERGPRFPSGSVEVGPDAGTLSSFKACSH